MLEKKKPPIGFKLQLWLTAAPVQFSKCADRWHFPHRQNVFLRLTLSLKDALPKEKERHTQEMFQTEGRAVGKVRP